MNRQPFQTPPRRWATQLTPWYVTLARALRRRTLARQRLHGPSVRGAGPVRRLLDQGAAVLFCPNHSFHYDSYVLIEASQRLGRPCHFMTAWQVFAMSTDFEQWSLQRHGCFSVDREANDLAALRTAIELLRDSRYPLVVFAEGDIFHTNDLVQPFREGAAAVALGAARRADRPVYIVPVALKCWYTSDPTPQLELSLTQMERRLGLRASAGRSLAQRVLAVGDRLIGSQEEIYFGKPGGGLLAPRITALSEAILARQEERYAIEPAGGISERVQELRRHHIRQLDDTATPANERVRLIDAMEDLFRVTQLSSYPGRYITAKPSIERIAETIDKLEEDVLDRAYPRVKGDRRVLVWYGEPISVVRGRDKAGPLTAQTQQRVQAMLNAFRRPDRQGGLARTPP